MLDCDTMGLIFIAATLATLRPRAISHWTEEQGVTWQKQHPHNLTSKSHTLSAGEDKGSHIYICVPIINTRFLYNGTLSPPIPLCRERSSVALGLLSTNVPRDFEWEHTLAFGVRPGCPQSLFEVWEWGVLGVGLGYWLRGNSPCLPHPPISSSSC